MTDQTPPEGTPTPLIVCFLHDHLKEVTRIQCQVIEAALLGDDFVSESTAKELRASAAVYISYADQISSLAKLGKLRLGKD
ncbi:MAG: hypothetical protein KTR21_13700 [Rhodobacteraceae bacterium]|nr:hypothetical protein [Paracoccaceae bacterium]